MSRPLIDVDSLTPAERLRLLDDVWESLSRNADDVPVTDAQKAELDRRIEEMDRDPHAGLTWGEVLEQLRASKS